MSELNKAVVLRFVEAMSTSDPEAAAPCLAPDAYTLAKGYSKFAGVRRYETIVGTIGAFTEILPTGLNLTVHSVTAEGDRVIVEAEGDGKTSKGTPYRNQYCFVFTLADGLIKQVNEYFCTIHAEEVLWPVISEIEAAAATG